MMCYLIKGKERRTGKFMKKTKKRLLYGAAVVFWLVVWQLAAMAIGQEVFLVSPIQALGILLELLPQPEFWQRIGFSAGRILLGFGLGAAAGTLVGAFTGYFGGWLDETLMRVNDAVTAFPSILLALVFISLLGFGKYNVILALGVAFVPSYARVIRSEFARHREMNYVKSARLMGAGHLRIMFLHILPNTRQVLLPTLVIGFNNAVLAEASMSYLGIGVKPPDVSLGYMLSESQSYMARAPWYMLTVGGVIVLLILGVSLLGEGLQQKEWGR